MKNYSSICKSILGEDIFEEIQKFEIYQKNTNTALNPEEIKIALQIVPRAILSFLIKELTEMNNGDIKDIALPFTDGGTLQVNKKGKDTYNGEILNGPEKLYDFKYRSIPGIGLLILSTFELYDLEDLKEVKENPEKIDTCKIQEIIDERLKIYDLINSVVQNKMNIRDAREDFINQKLNSIIAHAEEKDMTEDKKESKLKRFLEAKKAKEESKEFEIMFEKSEKAICSDCGSKLFDTDGWNSGCICSGDDRNKKVWLKKSEKGVKLKFSKGWDKENIDMLVESIKKVAK